MATATAAAASAKPMTSSDPLPISRLPTRRWLRWILWMVVAVGMMSGTLALWKWISRDDYSLPKPTDVVSMKVISWYDVMEDKVFPGFDVPDSHWETILAELLPYEPDPNPCTWEVLAVMEIDTPRRQCRIDLLDTRDAVGAFDVWADGTKLDGHRYYRGGDNLRIREALEGAFKESEKHRGSKVVATFPKKRLKEDILKRLNAATVKGSRGARFRDRKEAYMLLGEPHGVIRRGRVPYEVWPYFCRDGNIWLSIIEEKGGPGADNQILVYPTERDEF